MIFQENSETQRRAIFLIIMRYRLKSAQIQNDFIEWNPGEIRYELPPCLLLVDIASFSGQYSTELVLPTRELIQAFVSRKIVGGHSKS